VKRPGYSSATEAADALRALTIAYLMDMGPTVTLDALTRPIPGLGKPVISTARSTLYAAAAQGLLPFSTFHCGRRLLASTTAVLRTLDLDPAA
jgi:hypothetical protein